VEFEAFLEASIVFARSAVHRFKSKHGKHAGWKQWWDGLLNDPAVNFFRTERDWILKQASPRIGQRVFAPFIGPGGAQASAHEPTSASEFYYFENPDTPATDTIDRHLSRLAALLDDAERLFA
jgi:hypothetical protein